VKRFMEASSGSNAVACKMGRRQRAPTPLGRGAGGRQAPGCDRSSRVYVQVNPTRSLAMQIFGTTRRQDARPAQGRGETRRPGRVDGRRPRRLRDADRRGGGVPGAGESDRSGRRHRVRERRDPDGPDRAADRAPPRGARRRDRRRDRVRDGSSDEPRPGRAGRPPPVRKLRLGRDPRPRHAGSAA
jgi:hypothetical protein